VVDLRNVNVPIPWGGSSTTSAAYCNNALILFSPWDLTFEFSQITPALQVEQEASPGSPPELQNAQVQVAKQIHAIISMSPQHAKALVKALADNVRKYEEQFGTIPDIPVPGVPEGEQA